MQDERQAILLCILKVIADLLRKREVLYVFYLFNSQFRQTIGRVYRRRPRPSSSLREGEADEAIHASRLD